MNRTIELILDESDMMNIASIDKIFMGFSSKLDDGTISIIISKAIEDSLRLAKQKESEDEL